MNKETVEYYVPEQNEKKKAEEKKENWIKARINLLKNDKELAVIFMLHLLLIALHVYEDYVGDIEYYWYLRAGGCGLISLSIFFFGRKGLAYALLIYSCVLIYIFT